MSLTASFTASQALGLPSILSLTDTSTGSDGSIAARRVYLIKADGTYLVPSGNSTDYIVWAYANSSTTIDVLDADYALNIRVDFVDSGGNVLYTKTTLYGFTLYSEEFYYGLTQALAATYSIIFDSNYYQNKLTLRTEIDSANFAVSIGGDIAAAQACLNRAAYMIANQSQYF